MDLVLLVVRVVVGGLLFGHGAQKLFGWFGGHGLQGTGGFMQSLGFPRGRTAAMGAGLSESVGGGLLALGLFTPLAAAMVVGTMLNAIVTVHWKNGPWASEGGYELPLTYALLGVAVTAVGPGIFSLDGALGIEMWGGAIAILSAVTGVLIGGLVLATRKDEDAAATADDTTEEIPAEERRAA